MALRRDRTYRTWQDMKQRCYNPRAAQYKNYGARGIVVCERWMAFENFLADMGPKPEGLSIGRIDNDGPYAPWNCRWESSAQQAQNQRRHNGNSSKTHCKRGHEFTPENTYTRIEKRGKVTRACRECDLEKSRRRYRMGMRRRPALLGGTHDR